MVLIWGSNYHGRVDRVPGWFFVKTKFFHLYYFPLIPLQSWIVLEGTETSDGFQGLQTSLSLKSIFTGWLRAATVVGAIVAGICTVLNGMFWLQSQGGAGQGEHLLMFGSSLLGLVACLGLFFITRFWTNASLDRAMLLAEELGLDLDQCRDEIEAALANLEQPAPAS